MNREWTAEPPFFNAEARRGRRNAEEGISIGRSSHCFFVASDFPVDSRGEKAHPDKILFGVFGGRRELCAGVRHLQAELNTGLAGKGNARASVQGEPDLLQAWQYGWNLAEEAAEMAECSSCNDGTGNPCPFHG